jgi:hypothetical protein
VGEDANIPGDYCVGPDLHGPRELCVDQAAGHKADWRLGPQAAPAQLRECLLTPQTAH